jgi:hypothetical protein
MKNEVETILLEYQKAIYSQHPINPKDLLSLSNQVLRHAIMTKLKTIFLFQKSYSP